MASFEVATYKLRVEISRAGDPVRTTRNRIIELESLPMAHGIVARALLSFSSQFDGWSGAPAAGYLDDRDRLRPRLVGWFPADEFPYWYDVLRSESPVSVIYNMREINGASYVNSIGVGTTQEPVGEGPADVDAG